jgi:hypothetical protein
MALCISGWEFMMLIAPGLHQFAALLNIITIELSFVTYLVSSMRDFVLRKRLRADKNHKKWLEISPTKAIRFFQSKSNWLLTDTNYSLSWELVSRRKIYVTIDKFCN